MNTYLWSYIYSRFLWMETNGLTYETGTRLKMLLVIGICTNFIWFFLSLLLPYYLVSDAWFSRLARYSRYCCSLLFITLCIIVHFWNVIIDLFLSKHFSFNIYISLLIILTDYRYTTLCCTIFLWFDWFSWTLRTTNWQEYNEKLFTGAANWSRKLRLCVRSEVLVQFRFDVADNIQKTWNHLKNNSKRSDLALTRSIVD